MQYGNTLYKIFASLFLGRKCLKNIGLKERQVISLPGTPTCPEPTLSFPYINKLKILYTFRCSMHIS